MSLQEEGNRRHRGGLDRALMINRAADVTTSLFPRGLAGPRQVPDAPRRADRRLVGVVQRLPINLVYRLEHRAPGRLELPTLHAGAGYDNLINWPLSVSGRPCQ